MDLDDAETFALFLEVYGTLPRAGPGGDEHTIRALASVPGPTPATVLDLGCGPGAQTLALAQALPAARIIAVDRLVSMVAEANRRLIERAIGDRVVAVVGDMAAAPVTGGSVDLIWCEGAIYHLGITEALHLWRPLLRPGGVVAFTEVMWLVDSPPAEIRGWWHSEYPAISDGAGIERRVQAASYRTVASFTLPASAWWQDYYEPMLIRVEELKARHPGNPSARQVAAAAEIEIDRFRRFSDCYSYGFFIVQPA